MSVTRPRGPLPPRVYWFRRFLVLGVVLALVFGVSRLVDTGGGDDATPAASPASADRTPAATPSATPTATPSAGATAGAPPAPAAPRARKPKPTKKAPPPLPTPSGPCQDSDVKVVPTLAESAYAGGDVRLTLQLTTRESPACTWTVSADSVAVKLTSGTDRIWSSQQCRRAVPRTKVVLRRTPVTTVDVTWSGRRSDADCSRHTLWAEPGYYHVAAAALGSDPETEQFRLLSPAPVTITPTPTPKAKSGKVKKNEKKRPEGDA